MHANIEYPDTIELCSRCRRGRIYYLGEAEAGAGPYCIVCKSKESGEPYTRDSVWKGPKQEEYPGTLFGRPVTWIRNWSARPTV